VRARPDARRARRRGGLAAAVLLLAAPSVAVGVAELGRARDAQAAAEAAEAAGLDQLRADRAEALDLGRSSEAARARATAAGADLPAVVELAGAAEASRADLTELIAGAEAAVAERQGQVDGATQAGDVQALVISGLRQCLDGITAARAQLEAGEDDAARAALIASADVCREATLWVEGGTVAPAFGFDFPDPSVLRVDTGLGPVYYAYATNGSAGHIQVLRSTDLAAWTLLPEPLPELPGWTAANHTWAPAVSQQGDELLLYYAARERSSGHQCISLAIARSPEGPFHDDSRWPMLCQHDQAGSIDPSVLTAPDGRRHLLWKSEGNALRGGVGRIWSAPLAPDGRSLAAEPVELLRADRAWEGRVVEGPAMVEWFGSYVLLYSAGDWSTDGYSIAFATCDGPQGPCQKPSDGRVLVSHDEVAGPGGQEVFRDGAGQWWVAHHAWRAPDVGYPHARYLYVGRLGFEGGRPVVGDPAYAFTP
jgi:hypothetical protein